MGVSNSGQGQFPGNQNNNTTINNIGSINNYNSFHLAIVNGGLGNAAANIVNSSKNFRNPKLPGSAENSLFNTKESMNQSKPDNTTFLEE